MSAIARRAVTAEWTKLRSIPSTTWTALAVVGITVGLTGFMASTSSTDANQARRRCPATTTSWRTRSSACGSDRSPWSRSARSRATSEFASGTIRATLSAIPTERGVQSEGGDRRGGRVRDRAVTSVASFLIAQPLQHGNGYNAPAYPHVSLTNPFVLRAVVGTRAVPDAARLVRDGRRRDRPTHGGGDDRRGDARPRADGRPGVLHGGDPRGAAVALAGRGDVDPDHFRDRFDNPPYGPWVGSASPRRGAIGACSSAPGCGGGAMPRAAPMVRPSAPDGRSSDPCRAPRGCSWPGSASRSRSGC